MRPVGDVRPQRWNNRRWLNLLVGGFVQLDKTAWALRAEAYLRHHNIGRDVYPRRRGDRGREDRHKAMIRAVTLPLIRPSDGPCNHRQYSAKINNVKEFTLSPLN
jgi:hypothetical protein